MTFILFRESKNVWIHGSIIPKDIRGRYLSVLCVKFTADGSIPQQRNLLRFEFKSKTFQWAEQFRIVFATKARERCRLVQTNFIRLRQQTDRVHMSSDLDLNDVTFLRDVL